MSRSSVPAKADVAERYRRLLEVHALLAGVSREIGPAFDLGHVLRTVLQAMRTLVSAEAASIWLVDADGVHIAASDPESEIVGHRDAVESTVQRARVTTEVVEEQGSLAVPLFVHGEVVGVLRVEGDPDASFGDEDRVLLVGLATQVAGSIESARRYRALSELEVLKSDFIARVSHELRTPITIVAGFVDTLLANHERLPEDARTMMLERIDTATARLTGLIDELLMLSRLEAGVVAASLEDVPVGTALEEVRRQSVDPEAVTLDIEPGLHLQSDRGLLVRALGFLVDNALKYGKGCHLVARRGVIEVIDRGPGIPPAHRGRVFERFTRANENTTVPGMGIGLPMARTLLAAAGGELSLEDAADGIGTRMVVRFWG